MGFRALTVRQVERGWLEDRPGATAHEVADALATTVPRPAASGSPAVPTLFDAGAVRRPAGHPRPGGRRPGPRRRPGRAPVSARPRRRSAPAAAASAGSTPLDRRSAWSPRSSPSIVLAGEGADRYADLDPDNAGPQRGAGAGPGARRPGCRRDRGPQCRRPRRDRRGRRHDRGGHLDRAARPEHHRPAGRARPQPGGWSSSTPAPGPPRPSASPPCPWAWTLGDAVEARLRRPDVRRACRSPWTSASPIPSTAAASTTTTAPCSPSPGPGSVLLGAGEALSNDQVLRADNAARRAAPARPGGPAGLVRPVPRATSSADDGVEPGDAAARAGCGRRCGWSRSRRSALLLWRGRRLGALGDRAAAGRREGHRDHPQPGTALPARRRPGARRVRAARRRPGPAGRAARARQPPGPRTPWCAPSRRAPPGAARRAARPAVARAATPPRDHDLITLADHAGRARGRGVRP